MAKLGITMQFERKRCEGGRVEEGGRKGCDGEHRGAIRVGKLKS
jgi:hypothetical protein